MKAPKLAAIPESTVETSFSENAKEAKKSELVVEELAEARRELEAARQAQKEAEEKTNKLLAAKEAQKAVKRSFSLKPNDASYIEKTALRLAKELGRPVSASAALRSIIEQHRAAK